MPVHTPDAHTRPVPAQGRRLAVRQTPSAANAWPAGHSHACAAGDHDAPVAGSQTQAVWPVWPAVDDPVGQALQGSRPLGEKVLIMHAQLPLALGAE